ncbi:hypothetical protein NUW58_g9594 [Xylaria curta]|uniref:Uncharacterized protein n=1 Tax=Xylaria curta TaxID=42375 RepID=A0ACC1MX08_9PEZI|nr:hypothetical protein NUW58_g9594 [Xylaria curta]
MPSSHEKPPALDQDDSSHPDDSFVLGMGPSRLTQYLGFSVCSPCMTCYAGIPATSPYDYPETRLYMDNKPQPSHSVSSTLSQVPPGALAGSSPIVTQQTFPSYTGLQPNRSMPPEQWAVQPSTSHEGMCETNPDDKAGTCLTCLRVSNVKVWRMPCLRYKITDVRLFKPGQVKGHEWTRRWMEGVADDISHWASTETRKVRVTEGYTENAVELRVRQFVPQEGDSLERSWVYNGVRKRVTIPAYAIVNLEEAKNAYSSYISRSLPECCRKILLGKDRLLGATYAMALRTTRDPAVAENEKELLKKALQLWMAVRMTTKSTVIVGEETLGMTPDIMDETSPLQGKIPIPPVMGAQIELVLIHQIQSSLRREMLENLQTITQANKQHTWFTTYLITFILLHNVALLCQHDAGYARKHGMKTRFAREDMVREYQLGANVLLAYFHYCNKGIYPFSAECKEQDLTTLAALDESRAQFIKQTKSHVEKHRKSWAKLRESNDYENDFYYISQLYEENWMPQPTI